MLEAEAAEEESNSDDSDWSPSRHKTPGPKRRSRRSADSVGRETQKKTVEFASEASKLDETMETVAEDTDETAFVSSESTDPVHNDSESGNQTQTDITVDYTKLKVKELRELLRTRNLVVSGIKSELITRLQEHDRALSGSSVVVDLTGEGGTDQENSKENIAETNRHTSTRASRGRGGLQIRDMNKPSSRPAGKENTSKAILPGTPPQSTQKGRWSTKRINSVRRSTIFSTKKQPASPSSPDSYADSKPRNLGAQLAENHNDFDIVNSVSNRALAQLEGNIA